MCISSILRHVICALLGGDENQATGRASPTKQGGFAYNRIPISGYFAARLPR